MIANYWPISIRSKQDFYWLFDVIRRLHFVLILPQVSGSYLDATNAEPVHQFDKQRFGIYHHHILCANVVHTYGHTNTKIAK